MLSSILLTIGFLGMLAFLYFYQNKNQKAERDRFREFVIATKSRDIKEYAEVIPEEGEVEYEEKDDLVDLDQVEPDTLLKALRQEENENRKY